MGLIHGDGLTCFQFPELADLNGFFHGVFLRQAVNGTGNKVSFNLGMGHGTTNEAVWQNRERMLHFIGPDCFGVYARQVHGVDVGVVTSPCESGAQVANHSVHLDGDALITNLPGAALVIQVADCQPIIIVDPATGAVANIHSGWRGSLQNIIGATVGRMVDQYHSRPQDMVCGIGPSLGPCCAEFVNYKKEIPQKQSCWNIMKNI